MLTTRTRAWSDHMLLFYLFTDSEKRIDFHSFSFSALVDFRWATKLSREQRNWWIFIRRKADLNVITWIDFGEMMFVQNARSLSLSHPLSSSRRRWRNSSQIGCYAKLTLTSAEDIRSLRAEMRSRVIGNASLERKSCHDNCRWW